MTLGTRIFTWLYSELVGIDSIGNRYFRCAIGARHASDSGVMERRWVLYQGEVDAARVSPDWYGWLHHLTDLTPASAPSAHSSSLEQKNMRSGQKLGESFPVHSNNFDQSMKDEEGKALNAGVLSGGYQAWMPSDHR